MKTEHLKIVCSLLAASVAPGILYLLIGLAYAPVQAIKSAVMLILVGFCVALPHAVILGLPLYFLARKFNLIRWWTAMIGGALIGVLPVTLWGVSQGFNPSDLSWIMLFAACGMAGGIASWLCWNYMSHREKTV